VRADQVTLVILLHRVGDPAHHAGDAQEDSLLLTQTYDVG
jgi:hypothetical protein